MARNRKNRTPEAQGRDTELAESSVSYNDLPDEAIRTIFSFFTPQKLSSQLSHVSSKWHYTSRDPSLWRKLTLREIGLVSVVKHFRRAPLQHLRVLTVDVWRGKNFESLITLVATNCPDLERFRYVGPPNARTFDDHHISCFPPTSGETVKSLATGCPRLTHLSLFGIVLSDASFKCFEQFPALTHLDVKLRFYDESDNASERIENENGVIDNEGENACSEVDLKCLTTLKIAFSGRNCEEVRFKDRFCAFINKYHAVIKGLVISSTFSFVYDDDVWAAIYKCTNLTKLAARIDTNNLSAIDSRLPELTYLRWKCQPGDLVALCSSADRFAKLRRLKIGVEVGNYNVTDDVLKVLANRLGPQLRGLTISNLFEVTDVGMRHVIAKCGALEQLTLKYMTISKATLKRIPKCLPKLRTLTLKSCGVDGVTSNMLRNYDANVKVVIDNEFDVNADNEECTDNEYLPEDDDD